MQVPTRYARLLEGRVIRLPQEEELAVPSHIQLVQEDRNSSVVEWEKSRREKEMRKGPKPAELSLSEEEQSRLEALVHRHSTAQQLAQRGRMVLLAAQGKRNAEIARELGVNVDTVRLWRGRWIDAQAIPLTELSVAQRLTDAPRPGKPSQITAEQRCLMVALACEQPKECPISHWTGREIAEEMMQRGIIKYISPRHASRLLKKGI